MINVPLALASASASAMMPEVSGEFATGDYREANSRILQTIRLTMFVSIPAAVGLGVLSFPITGVLFPGSTDLSAWLLLGGSVSVVFSALSTITNSALQSIGRQKTALRNAAISLGLNVLVVTVILFVSEKPGIYAVLIANIAFSVSMCFLNNLSIRKYLRFRNEIRNTYLKPLAAAAGMGVVTWIVYYGLYLLTRLEALCLLAAIVVAVPLYLILYVWITQIPEEEMRRFPMGTKIVKVLKLLRIYT